MQNVTPKLAEIVIRRYIAQEEQLAKLRVCFAVKRNDCTLGEGTTQNFVHSICHAVRGAKIHFPTEEEIRAEKQKIERLWKAREELEKSVRKWRTKKIGTVKVKSNIVQPMEPKSNKPISNQSIATKNLIDALSEIYAEEKKMRECNKTECNKTSIKKI